MGIFKNKNKPKFIETKTIDWNLTTEINVEPNTYIKNIRLVDAAGNFEHMDIYVNGKHMERIYTYAYQIYRYFYKIKKLDLIPFDINQNGIYSNVKIEVSTPIVEISGKIRYDIYEKKSTDTPQTECLVSQNEIVTGSIKSFIKTVIKDVKNASKNVDKTEPPALNLEIGDTIHIFNHTKMIRSDKVYVFHLYELETEPEPKSSSCEIPDMILNDYVLPEDVFTIIRTKNCDQC